MGTSSGIRLGGQQVQKSVSSSSFSFPICTHKQCCSCCYGLKHCARRESMVMWSMSYNRWMFISLLQGNRMAFPPSKWRSLQITTTVTCYSRGYESTRIFYLLSTTAFRGHKVNSENIGVEHKYHVIPSFCFLCTHGCMLFWVKQRQYLNLLNSAAVKRVHNASRILLYKCFGADCISFLPFLKWRQGSTNICIQPQKNPGFTRY